MLKTLIKFTIGGFIISLVFWARLIRKRHEMRLDNLILLVSDEPIFFLPYFGLVIFFGILFYLSIKKYFNITHQNKFIEKFMKSNYSLKLQHKLSEYIIDAPSFVFNKSTQYFSIKRYVELPASYFTKYCNYPNLLVFIFVATIRVFITEVIFYNRLQIFLVFVTLMIPYLLFKIIVFILYEYSKRIMSIVEKYIYISTDDEYDVIYHIKNPSEIEDNVFTYSEIIGGYTSM